MINLSPVVARFVAFALAIVAVAVSKWVGAGLGHDMLIGVAGALLGKEFTPRTGDARVAGVHPDDLRG